MPTRSSFSLQRLQIAHRELCAAFQTALKEHDEHGYHYYSPALCNSVARFNQELWRATGQDEIRRRAEFPAERTAEGTPYAEAMARVRQAGLDKYVPMSVLKGFMPRYPEMAFIRGELEAVRRLLGPVGDHELTEQQRMAMQAWADELEYIEVEGVALHANACAWLSSLLKHRQFLEQGTPLPTERPTAKYRGGRPVEIDGVFTLPASAIHEMGAAADSLFAWARKNSSGGESTLTELETTNLATPVTGGAGGGGREPEFEPGALQDATSHVTHQESRVQPPRTEEGFVWFNATHAANFIGVTARTVQNWIRGRTIGIYGENGNSYRFSQAELDAKKVVQEKKKAKRDLRKE